MSLLQLLDRFQEGRNHMAIVSRFSEERAAVVKHEVKKNLTQRLMERVGMGDSDSDSDSETDTDDESDGEGSATGSTNGSVKKKGWKKSFRKKKSKKSVTSDLEKAEHSPTQEKPANEVGVVPEPEPELSLPQSVWAKLLTTGREQAMPDDAVLAKEDAKDLLRSFDANVNPLGIITLEDVLEELIGEEIYDEFDPEGQSHVQAYQSLPQKKGRGRQRERLAHTGASEDATAVEGHSAPATTAASPEMLTVPLPGPSRTNSVLEQALGLITRKKNRSTGGPVEPRSSSTARSNRAQNGQRRAARSDTDLPSSLHVPSSRVADADRISDVHEHSGDEEEEGISIPRPHARSGPDIGGSEK